MQRIEQIRRSLKAKAFARAEALAIEGLRANRLQPQLWVSLGEALLHRGYVGAARRCFDRAWLLDPEAHWVEEAAARLEGRADGEERVDIEALLRVPNASVAAAIIVKDEERTIGRCIESLRGAVDRILVFDNGSTDRTPDIASSYEDVELRRLEWEGSFGELRNRAMSSIDADWVLWVDGDEWLHEEDRSAVKEAVGSYASVPGPVVLNIWHLNYVGGLIRNDISQGRLFRLGQGLRYFGRIHEQVGSAEAGIYDPAIKRGTVRIRYHHIGYEPSVVRSKDKIRRNRDLLLEMTAEEPDNPGWWYFLGRETLAGGWHSEAVESLRKALVLAKTQPRFGRSLDALTMLLRAYKELGDEEAAAGVYDEMLASDPSHPNVRMLWAEKKLEEARELLKRAGAHLDASLRSFSTYRGMVSADAGIREGRAELAKAEIAVHTGLLAEAYALYAPRSARSAHAEERLGRIREQALRLSYKPIPAKRNARRRNE